MNTQGNTTAGRLSTCPQRTHLQPTNDSIPPLPDRGATPAADRISALLRSGLCHLVPEEALCKVKVLPGQLDVAGLGLSKADMAVLQKEVLVIDML